MEEGAINHGWVPGADTTQRPFVESASGTRLCFLRLDFLFFLQQLTQELGKNKVQSSSLSNIINPTVLHQARKVDDHVFQVLRDQQHSPCCGYVSARAFLHLRAASGTLLHSCQRSEPLYIVHPSPRLYPPNSLGLVFFFLIQNIHKWNKDTTNTLVCALAFSVQINYTQCNKLRGEKSIHLVKRGGVRAQAIPAGTATFFSHVCSPYSCSVSKCKLIFNSLLSSGSLRHKEFLFSQLQAGQKRRGERNCLFS